MSVTATSGMQSLGSVVWAQLQQQQAQRNADQAEQKARSLQEKARDAQSVADLAEDKARNIKVESDQAQGQASDARQGLASLKSLGEVQGDLSALRNQLASTPTDTAEAGGQSPAPVVNSSGQTTGTLLNVTA
ncbi:hypothetical protein GBK02_12135 [Dechloromonas sp. TW-R-39-2]|uniref:hypothetical protein n=1 Tax=Dechloromonas sp. TW-R-39-2 TaxID=2654218 RepID=UPI00193E2DDC|nr:hypothetical protein [Dechloromonas sp. TW-R-39-2]QRM20091.1 hypothetical protein GBK02_12135 [Dechloromonas sp. TW-R-39-2]